MVEDDELMGGDDSEEVTVVGYAEDGLLGEVKAVCLEVVGQVKEEEHAVYPSVYKGS